MQLTLVSWLPLRLQPITRPSAKLTFTTCSSSGDAATTNDWLAEHRGVTSHANLLKASAGVVCKH